MEQIERDSGHLLYLFIILNDLLGPETICDWSLIRAIGDRGAELQRGFCLPTSMAPFCPLRCRWRGVEASLYVYTACYHLFIQTKYVWKLVMRPEATPGLDGEIALGFGLTMAIGYLVVWLIVCLVSESLAGRFGTALLIVRVVKLRWEVRRSAEVKYRLLGTAPSLFNPCFWDKVEIVKEERHLKALLEEA